jgi:hypothetical protein
MMICRQYQQKCVGRGQRRSVCRQGYRGSRIFSFWLKNNHRFLDTELSYLLCHQKTVLIVAHDNRIGLLKTLEPCEGLLEHGLFADQVEVLLWPTLARNGP